MQGKGVVKFFLVVMTIVTLAQYLFILPTQKVEKEADRYATTASAAIQDEALRKSRFKESRTAFLDSMSTEEIFSIPMIKSYTYQELKAQQLALGLDLKGGMSVVLQVDLKDFIKALAGNSTNETFTSAIAAAGEAQKNAQTGFVDLFVSEFRKNDKDIKLSEIFQRNQALNINFETSDGDVQRILNEKADEAVDLTFKMLKERIDKLGVSQPNVSLDANRDLIIVELPGIDNPERARNFLSAAAKLEFWDVYRMTQGVQNAFVRANDILTKESGATEPIAKEVLRIDTTFAIDSSGNLNRDIIEDIDTTFAPFNTNSGALFNVFTLNNGTFLPAIAGTAKKNQIGTINKFLEREEISRLFPGDLAFKWAKDPIKIQSGSELDAEANKDVYELYMIKRVSATSDKAPLTGESVTNAAANPNPQTNEVEVSLSMDPRGARIWANMTTKAAQDQNREIAIVLDDEVVSAPRVNDAITTGRSSIAGNFTIQEGKDLANILQIGTLPTETEIIQESLVGPSLGQENIDRSINALLIGSLLVLIFMILYYGGAGIISIIALLLNLFFIFGALASYGTVLTLPGIAGIVLTIGMAVDANVIIYERIREELREGKSLLMAIGDGFTNSYSAIIDANVTTLLTAAVLAYFGLGPIKGFAVVLIIGVLSSLFTAVLVGRLMIDAWVNGGKRNLTFWTGFSKNAFANLNINWLGNRRLAYMFSGAFILLGIGSFFVRSFDLGVDFKGGRTYNVVFLENNANLNPESLKTALTASLGGETPTVKAVDTENTFNIVTDYLIDSDEDGADSLVLRAVFEGVNGLVGGTLDYDDFKNPDGINTHINSSSKVGPTIADDIKVTSFYAAIFALLFIFLYIFIRFTKWQYSLGAVAALFHDVLFVLSVFSLFHGILPFSMEVDQNFIAAILTVIGYSINDTVVVFDRIREFANIYVKKTKEEVINMAINSTVSRTVITSLTTLFVVLILFLFGGTSIKGFAFALLIGILVGTYSSIFIATPVMSDLSGEFQAGSSKKGKGTEKRFSKALEKAK